MIVEINVSLKHGVLDPQAKAIHQGLKSLGFLDVIKVSLSKKIILEFQHNDDKKALSEAEKMAEELLANTIIEDYQIILKKD
ncbi:phosphoribosylformylglycinamidine synthase subunit PurS [Helicobacter cappadocius]|uniref:Phosphoribosylformylglycinamidine synthase subunit PurS n=1 Tax=Helicobacter cappadocius TaxID=3063998 RepID=A0AA90PRS9_9HELI|nr:MULTISPECIES: phosphoribosylformylglycinamidine synthase subunit PurS [unclassified Helicobacter]MDO7253853.1 phosphoribosylformylglycinamidine synthase subunit PurS [Helicobacter sp. faydin-H75]MDP2539801.1 phosphoribosylformylglycinamidine synthase subunit PurS [Helicobacter sp. faydin-H76]